MKRGLDAEGRSFNTTNLALPDVLLDPEKPSQRAGSSVVKAAMVLLFAGNDYSSHVHMLRRANPEAANALLRFAQTVHFDEDEAVESGEDSDDEMLTGFEEKRLDCHEQTLALIFRSRNFHVMPFFTIGLGAAALRAGVSMRFYGQLTHVHLVHKKSWTIKFCRLVSAELKRRFDELCARRVRFAVFDNCGCAAMA